MEESKLLAVKNWTPPHNKKGVQRFLGFGNFYRKFVKNYADIAKPLTELTGKTPFNWTDNQQKAFD